MATNRTKDWRIGPMRRAMVTVAALAAAIAVAGVVGAVSSGSPIVWSGTAGSAGLVAAVVASLPDPVQVPRVGRATSWTLVGSPLEPYRARIRRRPPRPQLQLLRQLFSFPGV